MDDPAKILYSTHSMKQKLKQITERIAISSFAKSEYAAVDGHTKKYPEKS